MMGAFNFELMLWADGGKLISVERFLAMTETRPLPSWDASALSLVIDGAERIGNEWNLGRIDWIVAQLDAAYQRLRAGEMALLRSAVLDSDGVPWLLFEPGTPGSNALLISEFTIDDDKADQTFPTPVLLKQDSAVVYGYVRSNFDLLQQSIGESGFWRLRYPADQFLECLGRQVSLGAAALPKLEIPDWANPVWTTARP